ncbi:MarR family winged helix-turn-helix transcriptional regulator [Streptomyces sp. CMB-StM0423]|uniref:MarR family winged helix-turn-helix transcriptional regulator n=1 Tax=Streptomyces sp. CMB-StM0423 TaxID=2059884 RepID=UPI000C70F5CF|nr:MarR family transcriptional regulator [Streptomyces sp. CMB-StM0423]AUH42923.1 MarR family transcriptional regulator [Streptomyces sp. CMB-StM0423]
MNDVRWLTEDEQRIWRLFMDAVRDFNAHLDRQLRRDSGMPVAYYEILVHLSEAPGRSLRMSQLAELCRSSRSRLSHAVAALEKAGYVSRCTTDADRRGSVAQLTDAGFGVLEAAAPAHVTEVRKHLFDVLTPEQQQKLGEISGAVKEGLRPICAQARAEDGEDAEDQAEGVGEATAGDAADKAREAVTEA